MYANPGGVDADNYDYDCGDSCHNAASTAVITVSATNVTPAPGDPVTVTVDVSGGEASYSPLGVQIVSATTYTNSLPSDDGWTIVADPSGSSTYNYYEVESYSGSVSLSWDMTAPTSLGVHVLFAREMHGGPGTFATDSVGLVFTVTDYSGEGPIPVTGGLPTLAITSPSNAATVSGNITVNANIAPAADDPIVSASLTIDGVLVSELTEGPYSWTIDTTNLTEGGHRLVVTAEDSTGDVVSKEIAIFVDNESEVISMLEWMVTMGAGAVIIVCATGVLIVVALLIRKKLVERRSR